MDESKSGRRTAFAGESDLIQSIFAPLAEAYDGALGLFDDAALLEPAAGEELVLTADMLVSGVHFLETALPADAAFKALAVNISDLVAKGAEPEIYLLTLALPNTPDRIWLGDFAAGLAEAQIAFDCVLAGGDTVSTPGPLTISITALGRLPAGKMVKRSGARAGDRIYVTGTVGDAAAGLKWLRAGDKDKVALLEADAADVITSRYWRPRPDPALASVLREFVSGAMDISDGLAGDFAKFCAASRYGGVIEADKVPLSGPTIRLIESDFISVKEILTGGDDYEILASVPPGSAGSFEEAVTAVGGKATAIGQISEERDVAVIGADGVPLDLSHGSYDHFRRD